MSFLPKIPAGTLMGINYSGMHDTAVVLTDPHGKILFASSLERVSRVKQDGRPPTPLLQGLDWSKIAGVGISTHEKLPEKQPAASQTHPSRCPITDYHPTHDAAFYDFLKTIPAPLHFYSHHHSHLASAYFLSGYKQAVGFVYDAGTFNDFTFGGIFDCQGKQMDALDLFGTNYESKFTLLYAFVTAALGFSPSRHEGKITGLAAFGKPTKRCREFLEILLTRDYGRTAGSFEWLHRYSHTIPATLVSFQHHHDAIKKELQAFSREEVAATVQAMAEEHVIEILNRAKKLGFIRHENICLSGGLFANVKINQRIKEWGFKNVFVSPPMTDDGTALGAALLLAADIGKLKEPYRVSDMFFGVSSTKDEVLKQLKNFEVVYTQPDNPAEEIAMALHSGLSVAVFQGACEFGPRALGHRSVLASAQDPDINSILNKKFHRTEFMPFAPMTLWEDAQMCYENIQGAEHTAEFMTMTFNCTREMKKLCPAVVHVDGTARPQLIRKEVHPLIYDIIARYKKLSGRPAIINTSYNMHEEPIVGSAGDAIKAFLESGIDMLYIEGYLLRRDQNFVPAAKYLQSQVAAPTQKEQRAAAAAKLFEKRWIEALNAAPATPPPPLPPTIEALVSRNKIIALRRHVRLLKILILGLLLCLLAFFYIQQ